MTWSWMACVRLAGTGHCSRQATCVARRSPADNNFSRPLRGPEDEDKDRNPLVGAVDRECTPEP